MKNNTFSGKTLLLVTYSSITQDNKTIFVNRAFGSLIDDLAKSFKKIYYVAANAKPESSLYREGKSIYTYTIQAENVIITPTKPLGHIVKPLKRIFLMIKNQSVINKAIVNSDYAYIFLPGYSSLFAAFACMIKRKPYFLYFGSHWKETASFRYPSARWGNIFFRLATKFYAMFQYFITKRALFCLASGNQLTKLQKAVNQKTFETIPMIQLHPARRNIKERRGRINPNCSIDEVAVNDDKSSINILCVGNIQKGKGTIFLVRATALLIEKGINVNTFFIGAIDEEYQTKVMRECADLGIINRVHFIGYVSNNIELQRYYEKADLFVLPTLGEGFPRVIYEAMICSLPVVASDIDSIRDNLGNENLATLVPPRNPHAIAGAVIELCRNEVLREKRIEIGKIFAIKKLHGSPAEQFVNLLKKHGLFK